MLVFSNRATLVVDVQLPAPIAPGEAEAVKYACT